MFRWIKKHFSVHSEKQPTQSKTRLQEPPAFGPSDPPCDSACYKKHGDSLLKKGNWAEAAVAYCQAISQDSSNAEAHLNLGYVLMEQQALADAETSLLHAININPQLPDAFYFLGLIAKTNNQHNTAIKHLQQAIQIKPDFEIIYSELSQLLFQTGQIDSAIQAIKQAISLFPENADFHFILGNLHSLNKDHTKAEQCYARVASLLPDHPDIFRLISVAQHEQGKLNEAADNYRIALIRQPNLAVVHSNLGAILEKQGESDEARIAFEHALTLDPNCIEALNNLGNMKLKIGSPDEAISYFQKCLSLRPDYAPAHNNLGNVFHNLKQFDKALPCYRRATEIDPTYFDAINNLGNALCKCGQFQEAKASYQRALTLEQNNPVLFNNMGILNQELGDLSEALACYQRALKIKPDHTEAFSNLLFIHNFLLDQPPARMLTEARRFSELVASKAHPYSTWDNIKIPDRCLRIGLVSGDLRVHPVGFFLEGVLSALATHSADRLEFFAYHNHLAHDTLTERLRSCCRAWRSVTGLSDEKLAQLVRSDSIDILFDLSGHTAQNRLPMFAWKPAPIQATWLGYFATTGVSAIDYLIADPWTLPESEEIHFSESIWRLPETRLCFTPPSDFIEVNDPPALRNGHITFGCFNNLTKMNDAVVDLWARILTAIPDSCLVLKAKQLHEISTQQQIATRYAAHGIGRERLILEGPSPRADYLATYHQIDIALDPFPYTGGTTSAEALWMGIPVLTMAGSSFLARQGVGLLMNAGLPEWVATDADDYLARAVSHAKDLQNLRALRYRLRNQVLDSPLFNAQRFAIHFDSALRSIWQLWCSQQR